MEEKTKKQKETDELDELRKFLKQSKEKEIELRKKIEKKKTPKK